MRDGNSRRSFLKQSGLLLGGLSAGVPTVSASESQTRRIVDLEQTPDGALDELTIIHNLPQIDLAVVSATEDELDGVEYTNDLELELEDPKAAPYDGPTQLGEDTEHPNLADLDTEDGYTDALNEPLFNVQWDKQDQRAADVQREYRGEGTRVAIIDSGVYGGHPNLEHAVDDELSKNFTTDDGDYNPNGAGDHGTHVAGIVAGNDQNEEGMVGMAPGAEIVALRVFSAEGGAGFGDIIAAMVYSADVGCDVANMSLGAYPLPPSEAVLQLKAQFERAAQYALSNGTLPVASAGNSGDNLDATEQLSLPNDAAGVMSISATGPIGYRWDDENYSSWESNLIESWGGLDEMADALYRVSSEPTTPAAYTNYGADSVAISAPGGNYDQSIAGLYRGDSPFNNLWDWYYDMVLSTTVTETEDGYVPEYGFKAGTSMAAPNAAGTAALVKAAYPELSAAQLRAHLEETAAADVGPAKFHGSGHIDTEAAVETSPSGSAE